MKGNYILYLRNRIHLRRKVKNAIMQKRFYLARDAKSGTLIVEKTKDKAIKQLQKASKKRKIYA